MVWSAFLTVCPCGSRTLSLNDTRILSFIAENPFENVVDPIEVRGQGEAALDVLRPEDARDIGVGGDELAEIEALLPGLEAAPLDDLVGLLAGQAILGQGQENALGENKAPGRAGLGLHTGGR